MALWQRIKASHHTEEPDYQAQLLCERAHIALDLGQDAQPHFDAALAVVATRGIDVNHRSVLGLSLKRLQSAMRAQRRSHSTLLLTDRRHLPELRPRASR